MEATASATTVTVNQPSGNTVSVAPARLRDVAAIDKLLFIGILFFTILLITMSKWSPTDGQTFQVISGLLTAFSGAFFARINPQSRVAPPPTEHPRAAPAPDVGGK